MRNSDRCFTEQVHQFFRLSRITVYPRCSNYQFHWRWAFSSWFFARITIFFWCHQLCQQKVSVITFFFFHLHIVYSSVHHLKHCFWSYNFSITKYNRHSVWKNFKKLLFLCFFIIVFLFIVLMVSKKKIMKRKFATLLLTISNYLVLERRRVGTSKLFIFINPKKLGGTSNLFSLIILL